MLTEVLAQADGVRAVLFDVDGTLYRQGPVRRAMLVRLVRAHALHPAAGWRVMRVLSAYRKAQEQLRDESFVGDVAAEQVHRAARATGVGAEDVRTTVEEWMERRPLDVVGANARPGLVELLDALAARGTRLGVVSDYPAQRKLEALGVAGRFDVVLTAQDPQVHALKPDPRGLLAALDALGVEATDALYVGDRAEVDGAAAAAAGVRCVLVGGSRSAGSPAAAEPLEAT